MTHRPLAFVVIAATALPAVAVISGTVAVWVLERIWLPRIAGPED